MFFPAALHKNEHSAYGVTIPDLPGCFSCGDSVEDAIANAQTAAYLHIGGMIEDGAFNNLSTTSIADLSQDTDYNGATWVMIEIDPAKSSQLKTE